jgi:tape measure domain-containing protein
VKSSAEFDLMRQKITNSYEMIKNSSQATANDIVRAEQAKNNQLNSINEQQFGKQKTFLSDAKENWKAYTASIIAAGYAAKEMIDASLKMEQITSSLKAVTGSSQGAAVAFDYVRSESQRLGLNLESTGLAYAKFAAATKNTTLEGEGARKVFSGVSEAVTALKLPGESANGIFLALSQMMSKGKISAEELSGQLGERLPGAVKLTADAMGLTTQELLKQMQEGKLMSADVLPKLAEQLHKTYGSAAVEAAEGGQAAINRMNNAMFETKATVGDAIMPVFADMAKGISLLAPYITAFVGGLKMTSVELFGFVDKASTIAVSIFSGAIFGSGGFDKLKKDLSDIDDVVKDSKEQIYKDIDKVATAQEKAGEANMQSMKAQAAASKNTSNTITAEEKRAATARETATKQLTEAIRKANVDIDQINKTTFEKEMARIESEEKEWLRKTQNDVLVAEWKADQISIANQKQEDETFKMWRKASEDAEAAMKAEADMGVKMTDDTIKRGDERRKAEIEIYKDLRGYETENYNATLELIKKKETDLRALGVSEIAISAWVTEETRKAELKKAEYSDSFFEGVRAGLADITAKQTSWGKVGIDTVKSFSDNASKTMGSVFFDAYKGQLKSSTEYFTAFSDALVKTFTDALAKMIVDAALSKITMSFNATWTEGAGAVLGAVGKVLGYAADWFFGDMVPDAGQAYGGLMGGLNPGADSYANDTIPAMLSPGEYVMPRSAVNQETVGTLEYMRQTGQKPQGYYDGGMVYGNDAYLQDYERQQEELRIAAMQQAQDEEAIREMALYTGSYDSASTLFYEMRQAEAERIQAEQQAQQQLEHNNYLAYLARVQAAHIAKLDTYAPVIDEESYTQLYTTIPNILSQDIYSGPPMAAMEYLGTKNGLNVYGVGDDNAKIHGRPYYTVGGDGSLYYTYYAPTGGGFIGGIVSALTGGVSDILQGNPMGAALAESGILDGDLGGWLGALTGGATTVIKGIGEGDPLGGIVNSLTNILDNPLVNIADEVFTRMGTGPQQILNWLGVIPDDVYEMNYDWTMKIAHMVGAMYAAGAAEGWLGDLVMPGTFGAIGEAGTGIAATGIGGTEIAGTIARKILINEALKYITGSGVANPESGALGISFNGLSGGEGIAESIKNFPGSVGGSFGFPASNGLDYVPRDNFMIRAHEGEAVITKEENKKRRNGKTGGNVLYFNFPKAIVVDKRSVNELAELIYPRLDKLAAWGH